VSRRTWRTSTEDETIALGRELASELSGAVLLIGNLGAGKTTLAKGIVEGRHAAAIDEVSSPTFTLIHQYGAASPEAAQPVFHIDLYRLDEPREVESLGLDELFASGALVLLEWAERFPTLMPGGRTEIRLRALDDDSREITLEKISGETTWPNPATA
jgi:tRNA threonylcarbamoyladenosine biosynthesis protein TsaE